MEKITEEELKNDLDWVHNRFGHAVKNTGLMLDNALKMKENILLFTVLLMISINLF